MVGWIILLGSGLDFTMCAHHRSYGTRWVMQGGWVVTTNVAFAHMADARKTWGCTDAGTTLCQCTRVHSGPADHVDFLEVFGRHSKELASNIFEAKFQGKLGLVRTIVNKEES